MKIKESIITNKKRTTQSLLIMTISLVVVLGVTPFIIYRVIEKNWMMTVLDIFIVTGMFFVFVYTYRTNDTKYTSTALSFISLVGGVVSFYFNGGNIINWIYPSMLSTFLVVRPRYALYINLFVFLTYLPKVLISFDYVGLSIITISVLLTNVIAFSFTNGLRKQANTLKKLASEDYLTSTRNRRALSLALGEWHTQLKNHDKTVSLILLDLDHFKKINDTYGHLKGDDVLVQVSNLLKSYFKETKQIFRYGGEEFLVICEDCNVLTAFTKAEEFRKLTKSSIRIDGNELTISLGVAEYIKEETVVDWVHRVDLALYQAKNQGRDCVIKA